MTDTLPLQPKTATKSSPASVLRIRNFRLLWIGEGISLLGDQCYLIALPWLVCAGSLMTLFTLSAAFSPAVRAGME